MANVLTGLLRRAVRKHLHRPNMGVLLSGGIDSSTVAYFANELPRFTGYYHGQDYDERQWARLVPGATYRHEILITPEDFVQYFDDMLASVTPPFEGTGTFGQWMVAKHVAEHGITTVLTGESGDELFGGYARIYLVAGRKPPDGYEDYKLPDGYPTTLEDALRLEWEQGLPALLKVDKEVNGAHGITAIPAMLDNDVIDYVQRQPAHMRVGKTLLRDAMRGLLPHEIVDRTDKRGFPTPFVWWAQREPVKSFVRDRIGYIPDAQKPWDRGWWLDLCTTSYKEPVAAT